ncbi:MAG: Spy/CpxP family protein refolding chaperone [Candidatus Longimicrobiales bacterium M2_2A_002]
MKRIGMALGFVLLLLPLAVSAQGQQGRHGQEMGEQERMHQGMGMHQGMMQGHGRAMMMSRPGPGMLLRLQGTLGLTEDQIDQLESMHAEAHETMQAHQEAAQEARTRAHEAMAGDTPDLEAFESAMLEAAEHNAQAMVVMAGVHVSAGEVLTDEQRAKLETLTEAMHEMRGEGMHRMQGEGMHRGQGQGMEQREMNRSGG